MATSCVVDTNVLVHPLDRREPEKRERAREVLWRVGGAGTAALPTQVLSEIANACLRNTRDKRIAWAEHTLDLGDSLNSSSLYRRVCCRAHSSIDSC